VEITTGSDKIVTGPKGAEKQLLKWKIHQVVEKLIAGLLIGPTWKIT